jgi:replicative DNA helicase
MATQKSNGLRTLDVRSLAEKWEFDRQNKEKGIPFGIDEIDRETGGVFKDQFVVLIGPPGAGKSAHLLSYANAAANAGHRALFITIEMSDEHQMARLVAHHSGVPYKTIRHGEPNEAEKRRIAKALDRIADEELLIIQEVPAEQASLDTVNDLVAKYAPDAIYIDGAYLMQLPNVRTNAAQWERLSELTRSMKNLILKHHRPIFISTQVLLSKMTGGEVTQGSVGYSSSFLQDADIMLGVQPDGELPDRQMVKVLKFRDGNKPNVHVQWDWQTYTLKAMAAPTDGEQEAQF